MIPLGRTGFRRLTGGISLKINVVVVDPSPWQLGKQENALDCIKLLLGLLWEVLFIQWEASDFVLQSICHLEQWTLMIPAFQKGPTLMHGHPSRRKRDRGRVD